MAMVKKSVLIEHSSQQMFDLVDRVEDYPQFLPWCSQTHCEFRDDTADGRHVAHQLPQRQIALHDRERQGVAVVDEDHAGRWTVSPARRGLAIQAADRRACKIEFQLSYEFSSKMFEKVIGPVFSQIANTFVEAFVKRADEIHGVPHA
jgi:ribosome-associated toxin RatA of RatAB toxin-antitoxin module